MRRRKRQEKEDTKGRGDGGDITNVTRRKQQKQIKPWSDLLRCSSLNGLLLINIYKHTHSYTNIHTHTPGRMTSSIDLHPIEDQ